MRIATVFSFCLLSLALLSSPASAGVTYYVSPYGSGTDGRTPETAWQSVDQVNQHPPQPGDTCLFEAGETFYGSLRIWQGDPDNPITLDSYGEGRATIHSGNERGLWSCSAGGLIVRNLNFVGGRANRAAPMMSMWASLCAIQAPGLGRHPIFKSRM